MKAVLHYGDRDKTITGISYTKDGKRYMKVNDNYMKDIELDSNFPSVDIIHED